PETAASRSAASPKTASRPAPNNPLSPKPSAIWVATSSSNKSKISSHASTCPDSRTCAFASKPHYFVPRGFDDLFCKDLLIWSGILVRLGRLIRTVRHLIGHMLDPLFLGL